MPKHKQQKCQQQKYKNNHKNNTFLKLNDIKEMNLKDLKAPLSTMTFDRDVIEEKVGNIYEAIVILGKRAEQVNSIIKNDLNQKLDEFASNSDTLDEVFENREQIEVSKYYEKLPKPTLIAIQEWLDNDIYFRRTDSVE